MAFDSTTYALSKKYTKESLEGAGSLKGEPGPPGEPGKTPTLRIDENGHLIATY